MKRNPFLKVNDKTRADSIEKARKGGLEEEIDFGIEFGKRESAEKIKKQDTLHCDSGWDSTVLVFPVSKPEVQVMVDNQLVTTTQWATYRLQ